MRIDVEFFPQRSERKVDIPEGSGGLQLMKKLGLAPDVHILVRDEVPVPLDLELHDGDRIRIIAVVSGG